MVYKFYLTKIYHFATFMVFSTPSSPVLDYEMVKLQLNEIVIKFRTSRKGTSLTLNYNSNMCTYQLR